MSYPYTSPHDHPRFGPNPRDEIPQHCGGLLCNNDYEDLDEDNLERCTEDEFCNCSCEGCKESVSLVLNYDEGPEYDKYAFDDRDYDYGWD